MFRRRKDAPISVVPAFQIPIDYSYSIIPFVANDWSLALRNKLRINSRSRYNADADVSIYFFGDESDGYLLKTFIAIQTQLI